MRVLNDKPLNKKPKFNPIPQKPNNFKGDNMMEVCENKNVNMGKEANDGMVRDDSKTATRLLDKNWSPLIVRKYQMDGWPLFVSLITDCNLNDLDKVVYELTEKAKELGYMDGNIQSARNYCGFLNDGLVKHYNSIKQGSCEGVLICWYIDKCWISSAFGDMMTHNKCALEVYSIINTLPHI